MGCVRQPRLLDFERRMAALAAAGGVLLVDGDNVRGKAGFGASHLSLMATLARWSSRRRLQGSTVLFVDHGAANSSFIALGNAVVFAGPSQTADDIIATADQSMLSIS